VSLNTNSEVISLLIKAGADVNAKTTTKGGRSILMEAAVSNQNPEVCSLLIKAGADINAKDEYGRKAIDFAKKNDALKNTDAYWKLHDASFE
jgi:ankyrin repeat protein